MSSLLLLCKYRLKKRFIGFGGKTFHGGDLCLKSNINDLIL